MRAAALVACGLVSLTLAASPVRLEDPLKSPAWQHFYNNEYGEAAALFRRDIAARPDDPDACNHLAQAILYSELFRNGALESQLVTGNNPFLRSTRLNVAAAVRDEFRQTVDHALALEKKLLDRDGRDEQALYAAGVTHGLRGNYSFLVEKAWTDSLRDATASRKYSNRLIELEPRLTDAYLIQGLHDYIVGSLPFYARMFGFLAGFHGDRDKGIAEVERVARDGVLNRYDARIWLAAIYRREHRASDAIPLLKELAALFPRNALFRLEQVQMYSDAGNKDAALAVLSEVERLRASSAPGFGAISQEKIRYFRGNLLFWYGDFPAALGDMKAVTGRAGELDLSTAVLAWLRLGQLYDLTGDHAQATAAYKQAARIAPDSGAAGEAKSYIASPYERKHPVTPPSR